MPSTAQCIMPKAVISGKKTRLIFTTIFLWTILAILGIVSIYMFSLGFDSEDDHTAGYLISSGLIVFSAAICFLLMLHCPLLAFTFKEEKPALLVDGSENLQ